MESSQVSIFAVEVQPNELRSRMQMTDVVNRRHMRHAHMVNITPEVMTQGMRADFLAIDRLSQAVLDKVREASYIRATTSVGTDIHAELSKEYRWFKTSGIISAEKWGNLPGGECFTAPKEVNGVFVVDGVVGDFLCARYGILRATPLTINIEGNRITRIFCENKDLERDFWTYTHTDENSDRVGEFAIGTNIGVTKRDRKHPSGREVSRSSHRLRRSLRRAHWRAVEVFYTHRCCGPGLQYLAWRRGRRRADHARWRFSSLNRL